jgi:hypothetical protein
MGSIEEKLKKKENSYKLSLIISPYEI